jgi:hypothetical protein
MPTLDLFSFKEYVQLVQVDRNTQLVNWPMIQYDIKIYKGVTNTIDFVVRNNERRAVNLVGNSLECTVAFQDTGEIVLTKPAIAMTPTDGKAQLILDPDEIEDLPAGYYNYVVKTIDDNGIERLLFTDINKRVTGSFELFDGVLRSEVPAIEIDAKQFTMTPEGIYNGLSYVTGAFPGDAQTNKANGTHTVAVYQTKWLGKFFIQASLSPEPPMPSEWFDIRLDPDTVWYEFNKHNNAGDTPTLFNFDLNAYWVRFGYVPIWANGINPVDARPLSTMIVNDGVFHKVLYKN